MIVHKEKEFYTNKDLALFVVGERWAMLEPAVEAFVSEEIPSLTF